MYSRGLGSPNHQFWDPMILRVGCILVDDKGTLISNWQQKPLFNMAILFPRCFGLFGGGVFHVVATFSQRKTGKPFFQTKTQCYVPMPIE